MIGGLTGRPLSNSTGPRHADPDPAHVVGGAPDLLEQLGEALGHPLERLLRPERDVQVGRPLGQRRAGEIAHRDAGMRRAEVGDEHDAGLAIEGQHGRRAATRGGAAAGLVDEALREQRVDALGDGRAGEPGLPREVGPRDRDPLADQAQERAGAGRRGLRGLSVRRHRATKVQHE